MRTATTAKAHLADDNVEIREPRSGRRIKAARVATTPAPEELGLALSDALEAILDDEKRTA